MCSMPFPDVIIPVFHVDSVQQNMAFVAGGFFPSDEEGKWCGKGMYFWDNVSNAEYWIKTRKNKHPKMEVNIAKASLFCAEDDILDLTDRKTSVDMKMAASHLAAKYKVDININNNGNVINFVYDTLTRENAISPEAPHAVFSVVKMAGIYKGDDQGLIASNELSGRRKRPKATSRMRLIYAVREPGLLQKRKIFDPEKEEIPNDFSF